MEDREIIERLLPTDDELKQEILSRIATRISGVRYSDPDTGEDYIDDSALMDAVRTEAIRMAHETIKAKVDAIVEAALNEGFVPTNQWGEAKSEERTTLREMIVQEAKSWLARPRNSYDSNKTALQSLVSDIINDVWKKELEKETSAVAAQVKAGINAKLTDKITEAVAALLRDPARK